MTISVTRAAHLTLRARDLAKSRTFFEKVFGLQEVGHDERGHIFFGNGDAPGSPLIALTQAAKADAPGPECKKMFGMDHFAFELENFEKLKAAVRHLKATEVQFDHIVDRSDGGSVYFLDPDNNLLEFYYFVPPELRNKADSIEQYAEAEGVAV